LAIVDPSLKRLVKRYLSFVSSPPCLASFRLLTIGTGVLPSARCITLLFALSRASTLAGA